MHRQVLSCGNISDSCAAAYRGPVAAQRQQTSRVRVRVTSRSGLRLSQLQGQGRCLERMLRDVLLPRHDVPAWVVVMLRVLQNIRARAAQVRRAVAGLVRVTILRAQHTPLRALR